MCTEGARKGFCSAYIINDIVNLVLRQLFIATQEQWHKIV